MSMLTSPKIQMLFGNRFRLMVVVKLSVLKVDKCWCRWAELLDETS
ncbi:MAG: hypothetical protein K2Y28_15695 [Burkholderiaceae bacterium]|nr:hypothetical protein [Burkholderiaceae bacterium]